MLSKKKIVLFIVILLLPILSGCSSKNSKMEYTTLKATSANSLNDAKFGFEESKGLGDSNMDAGTKDISPDSRKLIRRINITLETLEFDSALSLITDEVKNRGGYSESSNIEGNQKNIGSRNAKLVLRIPSSEVDGFISLVNKNTNIISKNETSEDITLSYIDTQSKVKSLEIQQERLLILLEKADKLEDIIALESRLSEVRFELEQFASRLRSYDNLVDYSTVTIHIYEVVRITPIEVKNTWERMGTGLKETIYNIYQGFIGFMVWLVVNLPYIIIWGVIIWICFRIIRKQYIKQIKTPKLDPSVDSIKHSNLEEKDSDDSSN